jgi:hypothetical protein
VSDKPQRRVVCAANKYETGLKKPGDGGMVFIGVRHHCPIMRNNMFPYREILERDTEVQGFVDQYGVFMDRKEALQVAKEAGQLNIARIKTWPDNELFSEDLY